MTKTKEIKKLKGMLWGLVVGDCLGSPIQFTSKDGHKEITRMEPAVGVYGRDLPKGYWTDDSSMAFCIMESYVRLGRYDLQDIARNFVRWHDEGFMSSVPKGAFDIGFATSSAMRGLRRGIMKNGEENGQGNGSIMRFAPSFVIAMKEKNPIVCEDISDLTHNSEAVREQIRLMYSFISACLDDTAVKPLTLYNDRKDVPNSGWAIHTIGAAGWALQRFDTFRDGMLAAVNLGGDSDSIGAVYGQMAGAYYGMDAIPEEWIHDVKDWRQVDSLIDTFLESACTSLP